MSGRIELINCTEGILELIEKGDSFLSKELNLIVPDNWSTFGVQIFTYSKEQIKEDPDSKIWWSYLPIIKSSRTLIGTCGFKGRPDSKGIVEIGYEVTEVFQGMGYATEMANLLIDTAFKFNEVQIVQAHTLAEENASVSILRKCGFEFIKELWDTEDGLIWQWHRKKTM